MQSLTAGRRLLQTREGVQVVAVVRSLASNSDEVVAALQAAVDSGVFLVSLVNAGTTSSFLEGSNMSNRLAVLGWSFLQAVACGVQA